ncbi:hypothetical protein AMTR_s00061p00215860 [Amborella trichopoda]|uniref:Cathepsin propeptide inhibitor domain-containing protein n=1 Tax=Amborella trichopoda TaxID=13333 RepID=U5D9U0_AMBTC|nr:hypothetical protein AMTR_s00061p00215860 [Amborella trichopoda]
MATRVTSPLLFVLGLVSYGPLATLLHSEKETSSSMSVRFEQWMALHGRQYMDAKEREQRFQIFQDKSQIQRLREC